MLFVCKILLITIKTQIIVLLKDIVYCDFDFFFFFISRAVLREPGAEAGPVAGIKVLYVT